MPRFTPMPPDFAAKCVETIVAGGPTAMAPVAFRCSPEEAFAAVRTVMQGFPRTTIVAEQDGRYLDAICRTRVLRFKDRVQLEVDEADGVIHFQSYSTPTYAGSDLGANRTRMEEITARLIEQLPA